MGAEKWELKRQAGGVSNHRIVGAWWHVHGRGVRVQAATARYFGTLTRVTPSLGVCNARPSRARRRPETEVRARPSQIPECDSRF